MVVCWKKSWFTVTKVDTFEILEDTLHSKNFGQYLRSSFQFILCNFMSFECLVKHFGLICVYGFKFFSFACSKSCALVFLPFRNWFFFHLVKFRNVKKFLFSKKLFRNSMMMGQRKKKLHLFHIVSSKTNWNLIKMLSFKTRKSSMFALRLLCIRLNSVK